MSKALSVIKKSIGILILLFVVVMPNNKVFAEKKTHYVKEFSIDLVSNGLERYFPNMELAPLEDGKERYLSKSFHKLAALEIMRDKANINTISLIVFTPKNSNSYAETNAYITKYFFYNVLGASGEDCLKWFMDKLSSASGVENYRQDFGDKEVSLLIVKSKGMVTIGIRKLEIDS